MTSHKQKLEMYFPLKTDVIVNYMYKSYLTSLRTHFMPINLLEMYVEIIAVYCEKHTKHIIQYEGKIQRPLMLQYKVHNSTGGLRTF